MTPAIEMIRPLDTLRRRVDWEALLGNSKPEPSVQQPDPSQDLSSVVSAFQAMVLIEDEEQLLKTAVEFARERLGLKRTALFLRNDKHQLMLGTWGTNLAGETVDERGVMYQIGESDRNVFQRAEEDGHPYSIIKDCPLLVHTEKETTVVGKGWVACTPIRSARGTIGMFFNDTAPTGEPVQHEQQLKLALFCSLFGALFDRGTLRAGHRSIAAPHNSLVVGILRLLSQDPSLGGKQLAAHLNISLSRLARVFKQEMGMSLVHYRNRLRLERFDVLINSGTENLLEAALASGFGSYAQFHRVFVAERGAPPTRYLKGKLTRKLVQTEPPPASHITQYAHATAS